MNQKINYDFQFLSSEKKKIGIILLDTEGAFDHQNTINDSAIIYSLSTLFSRYKDVLLKFK